MTYREAAPGDDEQQVSAVSEADTRRAVALLTALNLLNYVDRFVLPAILESVRRDVPMDGGQQGFALSSFILVYMLAAPVFGRLGEKGRRAPWIALGVAVWSLATASTALAHSYPALLLSRSAVGIGEAAYATLAPALLGDYFPKARRGRVLSFFYLAIPVGSAIGYTLAGVLSQWFSWRVAFLAVGAPGLLLAFLALRMTEPPRGQFDGGASETVAPLRDTLRALWNNAEYVRTVLGYTAYTFALGGLAQWMPTWLIRTHGMTEAHANGVFGPVTVLAGILGTAAGSELAERLRTRGVRHPYLVLSGWSTLLVAPFAFLVLGARHEPALWGLLAVAEVLAFASTGPINTLLVNCVPSSMRTTAFSLSILASHLLGDALSPPAIGLLSDATTLDTAMMTIPSMFLVAGVVWIVAARRLPAARA